VIALCAYMFHHTNACLPKSTTAVGLAGMFESTSSFLSLGPPIVATVVTTILQITNKFPAGPQQPAWSTKYVSYGPIDTWRGGEQNIILALILSTSRSLWIDVCTDQWVVDGVFLPDEAPRPWPTDPLAQEA